MAIRIIIRIANRTLLEIESETWGYLAGNIEFRPGPIMRGDI